MENSMLYPTFDPYLYGWDEISEDEDQDLYESAEESKFELEHDE